MQKKTGKPFLVLHGDLNDLRLYSEEQSRTNIEAFVEQLAQGYRALLECGDSSPLFSG